MKLTWEKHGDVLRLRDERGWTRGFVWREHGFWAAAFSTSDEPGVQPWRVLFPRQNKAKVKAEVVKAVRSAAA